MSAVRHHYHLVKPSLWPIAVSGASLLMFFGAVVLLGTSQEPLWGLKGSWLFYLGLAAVVFCSAAWWHEITTESNRGENAHAIVRTGLRYGMILFILSEVMFFAGWFWAFFNFAMFADPGAAEITTQAGNSIANEEGQPMLMGMETFFYLVGQTWPPVRVEPLSAWGLPLLNTFVLLLSGTTVTWAHHALLEKDSRGLFLGLGATVILGVLFSLMQAVEYYEAIANGMFSFSADIYGATFFMATGFHGLHVIVGTIFLAVCWYRAWKGRYTPEHHLGFECAAWYWHFVDVVWIVLFFSIYILGNEGLYN